MVKELQVGSNANELAKYLEHLFSMKSQYVAQVCIGGTILGVVSSVLREDFIVFSGHYYDSVRLPVERVIGIESLGMTQIIETSPGNNRIYITDRKYSDPNLFKAGVNFG